MKIAVVILCITCLLLVGCYPPNSVEKTGYYECYYLVRNVVPFAQSGYNDNGDNSLARVYLLDTDDFGRNLYVYHQYSYMLNEAISIWLICQQAEDGVAYYYSDVCYVIKPRHDEKFSEKELDDFKQANDWNQEILTDKCAWIKYSHSIPKDALSDEMIRAAFKEYFKPDENRRIGFDQLEVKGNKQVILASEYSMEHNVKTRYSAHLVMLDVNTVEVLASSEIPLEVFDFKHINQIGELIKQFKQQNSF